MAKETSLDSGVLARVKIHVVRNTFLECWAGFSIGLKIITTVAGLLLGSVFCCLLYWLSGELNNIIADIGFTAIFTGLSLLWFLKGYPTLFDDNDGTSKLPPAVVSLLNFFFGGVIFGCLFNHNLTRRRIGVSYEIAAGIIIAATIIAVIAIVYTAFVEN